MLPDLDAILRSTTEPEFKSSAERRIAEFLERHGIRYVYEAPVAVQHRGKVRLYYPDFHLPDLGVYVEYFGGASSPGHGRSVAYRIATYATSGVHVIPVRSCQMAQLSQYLTREIRETASYRNSLVDSAFLQLQHN